MAAPIMMFTHTLDALKGWFSPYAVDISGKMDAAVTADPIYAGRVVCVTSLDADVKTVRFKPGAVGHAMPIFLLNGTDQLDVNNTGSTTTWQSIAPAGYLSGLVAVGALELETTEFDTTQTYVVNDLLRAVRSDSSSSTAGTLTNQTVTLYTTLVCGVVSRGKRTNQHGITVLDFWPVYLPGSETTTL